MCVYFQLFCLHLDFEFVGNQMGCMPRSVYSARSRISYIPGCDGWDYTSLEECKQKCLNNEVPEGCNETEIESINCKYVIWDENVFGNEKGLPGWCELSDNTCEIITYRTELWKKKDETPSKPNFHSWDVTNKKYFDLERENVSFREGLIGSTYMFLAIGFISVLISGLAIKLIRNCRKKGADFNGGVIEKGENSYYIIVIHLRQFKPTWCIIFNIHLIIFYFYNVRSC